MKRKNILIHLICLLALSLSACTPAEEPGGTTSLPQSAVSQTAETSAPSSEAESGPAASSALPETSAAPSEPAAATASQTTSASQGPTPDTASLPASPAAEAPADEPSSAPATSAPAANRITVTLSVDCRTGVEEGYQAAIDAAEDGEILSATTIVAQEGTTAYDLLLRSGLEVEADTTIMGKYVLSIQGLGEKDCGPTSGWLYSVNGEFPGKPCSKYKLADGDVVCWRYTLQNGADLYQ